MQPDQTLPNFKIIFSSYKERGEPRQPGAVDEHDEGPVEARRRKSQGRGEEGGCGLLVFVSFLSFRSILLNFSRVFWLPVSPNLIILFQVRSIEEDLASIGENQKQLEVTEEKARKREEKYQEHIKQLTSR